MKKVVAVVLVCALCFALAACGKKDEGGNSSESGATVTPRVLEEGENLITGYKPGNVTLGQYTGLTYKPLSVEVTEEEVQAKLDQYVDSYKTKVEVTDRDVVQTGDIVDIDYEGFKDGENFNGGTGSISTLQIGSNYFITSFEDALIGKSKGEFSIDVVFPDYYKNTELAGQPAVFKINLKGIYKYEYPELTDAFVAEKTLNKYETVEAYKENIRSQIKSQKEEDAQSQKEYDLIMKLIENTTYNIDMDPEIEKGEKSLKTYNDSAFISAYGMDAAGYYSTYLGISAEQYNEMIHSQAEISVKYEFALSAIAATENFSVTDQEIDELGKTLMSQYGYTSLDEFVDVLASLNGVDGRKYLAEQVKLNKAGDLVKDTAIPEE